MKVVHVVGARPNFMKIAPIMEDMGKHNEITQILIHTGQHYDDQMSKLFFNDLEIPEPNIYLGVGSASHGIQTAKIMMELEPILMQVKPDWLVVVGDVNSTLAASLTASKLGIRIAHVEAGLRSFDRTMPEEINRVVTDAISDYLFITEKSAYENLVKEGVAKEKIHFVGNVMIDTLVKHRKKADPLDILSRIGAKEKSYGLVTLHRPINVDIRDTLEGILWALNEISGYLPLIFPCHPRTLERIKSFNLLNYVRKTDHGRASSCVNLYEPLGYLDFLKLMASARIVLTDSGGIQEETTILGVPCLTLRENTERPITVNQGTNVVVGTSKSKIVENAQQVLNGHSLKGQIPELWDGKASERIVRILIDHFS